MYEWHKDMPFVTKFKKNKGMKCYKVCYLISYICAVQKSQKQSKMAIYSAPFS